MCVMSTGVRKGGLTFQESPVVLHGIGTTCTEYLLRGIGMPCWAVNNFKDYRNVITGTNDVQVDAIIGVVKMADDPGVRPVVRIPMTASYWLNISTTAAKVLLELNVYIKHTQLLQP